ncbi:MAG: PilZ domain-containing protein [Proteobacteria bacterium]|nr:PilZ domain-containing protein [Pseudomonadota bacterium]
MSTDDDRRRQWNSAFPERRSGDGRRAHPRALVGLIARGQSAESAVVAVTELSVGGLYLERELELQDGDPIEFDLFVPGCDEPVRIDGVIRYRAEDEAGKRGMGIRFDGVSGSAAKVIEAYLDRLARAR